MIQERDGKLEYAELEELFEIGILTASEQKQLVTTFIPTISAEKALGYGIITEKNLERIKRTYARE